MTRIIYNLALHCLVAPALLTYYVPQILIKGKYRQSIRGKLGNLPPDIERNTGKNLRIWFHAVSVGEVVALAPLVDRIKALRPDIETVISTGTETGQQRAHELIPGQNHFFYMPLDFPFAVKRVVNVIRPDIFAMTETEIWPNLIHELRKSGASIALVNGRISDRSFPRYKKFKRFLRETLASIDLFSMCSDEDASRIIQMGADPGNVAVTGNIKIDSAFRPPQKGIQQNLMRLYGLEDSDSVIVAGSVHPGEDDVIIQAYRDLLKKYPRLILIMAPRHLERIKSMVGRFLDAGLGAPLTRSELDAGAKRDGRQTILIDRMGELFSAYSIATVVFVGGSLVPRGGQNILEPASWSKPVIFGPHMEDFRDSCEILLRHKAAFQVSNSQELLETMDLLLADTQLARQMGKTAYDKLSKHVGSARNTSDLVLGLASRIANREKS